ncbi:MAG: hypothetical protein GX628_08350 [Clostridiales bacterium]|nr:hypothetical protein [Clostridiales bacterium]
MINREAFRTPSRKFGPLQVVHDFNFVALNLPLIYEELNDMTPDEKYSHIRGRLDRMKELGYRGVVLNSDFGDYLSDKSMLLLRRVVDYIAELGLEAWIYDEQYYPTGSAGGHVLRGHPELNNQGLSCICRDFGDANPGAAARVHSPCGYSELKYAFAAPKGSKVGDGLVDISEYRDPSGGLCWDKPAGEWRVWCFFIRVLYENTYLYRALRAPRRCPSVLDKRAMARFLEVTFAPYEKYLGDHLGSTITNIFTDEPSNFGLSIPPKDFVPEDSCGRFPNKSIHEYPDMEVPASPYIGWCDDFAEKFEQLCGYSLIPRLPELFSGKIADTKKLRRDYCKVTYALFREALLDPYTELLDKYGMGLSGHLISEETFEAHPQLLGNYLEILGDEAIPGCDLLYSDPEKLRRSMALILASSAAYTRGREHVMIEASNMVDKDQTFSAERICHAMALMFANGIDTITSYYGERLLDDEGMKTFAEYTARLGEAFDGGKRSAEVLVWYPYEYLCSYVRPHGANMLPDSEDPDTGKGAAARESAVGLMVRLMDEGRLCSFADTAALRERLNELDAKYLVLPDLDGIDSDTAAVIAAANAAGVRVFCGSEKIGGLDIPLEPLDRLPEPEIMRVEGKQPMLCLERRVFGGCDVFLAVNASPDEPMELNASLPTLSQLNISDIASGVFKPLAYGAAGDRSAFRLSIPPKGALLIEAQYIY